MIDIYNIHLFNLPAQLPVPFPLLVSATHLHKRRSQESGIFRKRNSGVASIGPRQKMNSIISILY